MIISVKMSTCVGILTPMSMKNTPVMYTIDSYDTPSEQIKLIELDLKPWH